LSKEHKVDRKPKKSESFRALAYFSQIGVTMATTVLVSVLLGRYLDSLLDTTPWLLLFFSALGVGAAIKALFNMPKDKNDPSEKY